MNVSLDSSDNTLFLQRNAQRVSLNLLGSAIVGTLIAIYVAWQSQQSFIYYYVALFCLVGIMYGIGAVAIFNKRRHLGVGFLIAGMISAFISIPFSFINISLGVAIIIGFGTWLISVLCLEGRPQFFANVFGIGFALLALAVDFFAPLPRIFLPATNVATSVIGIGLISILLLLFFLSFRAFQITTKLIVITVTIILFATTIPTLIVTQSTRNALVSSTETEIELRGESVASKIESQLQGHIGQLETLVANQIILNFINADTSEFDDLLSKQDRNIAIVERVLEERNRIWINLSDDFTLEQHFLFFSRLRNSSSDILRNFTQQSPATQEIIIVNKFGSVVAMGGKEDAPQYLYNDTEWWDFVQMSDGREVYIGDPIPAQTGSGLAIPIAVPILDVNNNVIGTIFTTYSTSRLILDLELDEDPEIETNFAMVVSPDALLPLVRGQSTLVPNGFNQEEINELLAMNFVELQAQEETNIFTAVPLNVNPNPQADGSSNQWSILVSRPLETVERVIREQQLTQTILGLVLALIGIFLARFISIAVSSPITNLADVANQLETGNLDARATVQSADEVGRLSIAFNQMADQSQRLINQLEDRVQERTQALETSFRVSQNLSSITETDELVTSVVNELQSAFDYYHVHIYLFNEANDRLEMVAGSGEAGKALLRQGHWLSIGSGLVGRAASENGNVLAADVTLDPQWVANPHLPETKSEIAVPISLGNEVLGVIDIQDDEVNRFSDQDSNLLGSIADQVAVALRNSEQYERARNRANREQRLNQVREKILQTQDVESAMKTAVREISQMLGNKNTAVYLTQHPEEIAKKDESAKPKDQLKSKNHLNGHSNGNHG